MNNIIKLEGEIDLSVMPNECRIKPNEDIWMDFGYWLEATGFMTYQAMKYCEWSEERILDYAKEYLKKCIKDYHMKL